MCCCKFYFTRCDEPRESTAFNERSGEFANTCSLGFPILGKIVGGDVAKKLNYYDSTHKSLRVVMSEGVLTASQLTASQLTTIIKSIVNEELSHAMVDIRRGQSAIIKQIDNLNNTVLALKNTQSILLKRLDNHSPAPSIVYINNTEPPKDLFGNVNNISVE